MSENDPFMVFAAPDGREGEPNIFALGASSNGPNSSNRNSGDDIWSTRKNAEFFDESIACYLFDERLFSIKDAKNRLRDLFDYLNDTGLVNYSNIVSVQTYASRNVAGDAVSDLCDFPLRTLRVDLSLPKSVSLQIKELTFFPSVLFFTTVTGVPYLRDLNVDALVTIDNDTLRSMTGRKTVGYAIAEYIAAFREKIFNVPPRPFARGSANGRNAATSNAAQQRTNCQRRNVSETPSNVTAPCVVELDDREINVEV